MSARIFARSLSFNRASRISRSSLACFALSSLSRRLAAISAISSSLLRRNSTLFSCLKLLSSARSASDTTEERDDTEPLFAGTRCPNATSMFERRSSTLAAPLLPPPPPRGGTGGWASTRDEARRALADRFAFVLALVAAVTPEVTEVRPLRAGESAEEGRRRLGTSAGSSRRRRDGAAAGGGGGGGDDPTRSFSDRVGRPRTEESDFTSSECHPKDSVELRTGSREVAGAVAVVEVGPGDR
mmetsp:Transcript_15669/g.36996  ORF Transcript_15669/g.36996 Transcript_15669/m.36996 type:complete len:242 (-) Transcript_15669:175-900(-)